MMNVTISMDDELYRQTRIDAAKAGKSMSKYIAERLRDSHPRNTPPEEIERRLAHIQALREVFEGPTFRISEDGRMPTADERNARR